MTLLALGGFSWGGLAVLFAEAFAALWLALVWYSRWTLTHPMRRTRGWAVARSLPADPGELVPARAFQVWNYNGSPLWDVRGDDLCGPLVILTHGWGESRIHGLARLPSIGAAASRVIIWELPGHGEAPDRTELGRTEHRLLRGLIDIVASPDHALVLYGSSLGAGVSISAAAEDPRVSAVIAEAPYRLPQTPAANVLAMRGLPRLGALDTALWTVGGAAWMQENGPFDRAALARRVRVPLTVLHGDADGVCPIEDGRAIAGAAPGGNLVVIAGGGHLDLWSVEPFRRQMDAAVRDVLWRARRSRQKAAAGAGVSSS